jgi:hypothetical protein
MPVAAVLDQRGYRRTPVVQPYAAIAFRARVGWVPTLAALRYLTSPDSRVVRQVVVVYGL